MAVDAVTVPLEKYARLLERDDWLECLEAAGVDNWEGIEEAIRIRNTPENDCE